MNTCICTKFRFSEDAAKDEVKIELTKLYEDQVSTFVAKTEDLLKQLEIDEITTEQYDSQSEIYKGLITRSKDELEKLS